MKIAVLAHRNYPIGHPYPAGLEMHTHILTVALNSHGLPGPPLSSPAHDPPLAPVPAARLARAVRTLHQAPASQQAHVNFRDAVAALLH